MERFNIIRNALHMYNTVHVSALYTIPQTSMSRLFNSSSSGPDAFQALVFSCLASVIQPHPILGVTIQDEASPTTTYQRLNTIDFTQIVKIIQQDPEACPDTWLQAGLRQKLDRVDELPVWRIIVAVEASSLAQKSSDLKFRLAFFAHHVIADGISCGAFHITFLEALNTHIASSLPIDDKSIVLVPKQPLVLSLEENAYLPLTIWFMILVLVKEYIYNPIDTLAWSGPAVSSSIPSAPVPVRLRSFALPPAQVTALVQKCRDEGTSVTGLMLVLIARKLGEMFPGHKHFVAGMPMSVRRFTGHGERDMGVFVTSCASYFSSEERPGRGWISCASSTNTKIDDKMSSAGGDLALWDSARKAKQHITTKTSSPKNQVVTMLKFVKDYRPFFLKKLGDKRESAFELTNITTIDGGLGEEGSGKAWLDRAMFCGGLSTYAAPIVVSVVSVRGGEMNICVTWEEGVVSEEEGNAMTEGLKEGLMECTGVWEM